MHDDDDHGLREAYDLDAWAPPSAPDVTAAVIARMTSSGGAPEGAAPDRPAMGSPRSPVARAAATTTMVEQRPAAARTRRRWMLAGIGFGATALGALVTYLLMRDGGPGSDQGAVATAAPSRLDLGASAAQLEANTELTWRRDGHTLRVDQVRGTSTWTLGPDETLDIKTGGAKRPPYEDPAGAVAGRGSDQVAIRATGASLRVEVGMNLSDAKIIGASAVAASAVAAITIVVYEGQAQVTSAGQTVEVRAGGTLEARADRAPAPREHVGNAPTADDADLADRKKLQVAIDKLRADLASCTNGTGSSPTEVELLVDVTPDGGTEIARLHFTPSAPDAAELCVIETVTSRRSVVTRLGGRFPVALQLTKRCDPDELQRRANKAAGDGRHSGAEVYRAAAKACSESCDHDTPSARLDAAIARGDYAEAIEAAELALACKDSQNVLVRAFLAACNGRFEAKANEIYRRLSLDAQHKYSQMCSRNGVHLESSTTVADATSSTSSSSSSSTTSSKDPNIQAARVALADRKWDTAIEAAERAKGHPEAKELYDLAHKGARAEAASRNMEDALQKAEYNVAAKALTAAKEWPSIGAAAEKAFTSATAPEVARLIQIAKARALSDETCVSFRAYLGKLESTYPMTMVDRVRAGAGTCPRAKAPLESGTGSGSSTATTKPPKNPDCKPDRIKENKANLDSAISRGAYREAIAAADRVLACGFDVNVLLRGFLAACNGRDAAASRRYYKSLSPEAQAKYAQMCARNGVQLP